MTLRVRQRCTLRTKSTCWKRRCGIGGCAAVVACSASTLGGHVAVAVAVKVHGHDQVQDQVNERARNCEKSAGKM
jgi:hypothetical protein